MAVTKDKKNTGKDPSYQMYPKDWNENAKLKMCSYAAQGLWIRLINTSFDMPVKGVFMLSKHPLSGRDSVDLMSPKHPLNEQEVLDLLPGNMRTKRAAFRELVKWNVIKQGEDKAFYCKRLRNDMKLREIRREVGKLGGNPNLVKNLVNQNDNQSPTPSTSTSNSTPTSTIEIDKKEALGKERLGLNKEVKIRAVKFGEELDRIFPNISRDEATTFLRVAQHLTEEVILGVGLEIFDEAVVWAKQAMSGNARNPKGLFVAKVKEQTGFTGRGMLLDRKE